MAPAGRRETPAGDHHESITEAARASRNSRPSPCGTTTLARSVAWLDQAEEEARLVGRAESRRRIIEKGHLKDAYNTFRRVCDTKGFAAFKIDQHFDANQRIVPNIIRSIRRSAFIIADVSEPRPNVYYELGYAQALGKDVILTAAEGTDLPFDIFDVPTLMWDCQDTLERRLERAIGQITV